MTDLELVQKMIRRGAEAVAERFSEETRFGVDACLRTRGDAYGERRTYVLKLVLWNPPDLRALGSPEADVLWEVEGPSANGAVVRFRRRIGEVQRPPVPRRRSS